MTSSKQRKQIVKFLKEKCDVVDVIFQHNGAVACRYHSKSDWYFVGWEEQIINQLVKQAEAGKIENSKT